MSKDPDTPERYAVDAMQMAIGTLSAFTNDDNDVRKVIAKLERAITKFDARCDHDWKGAEDPRGGLIATCSKCFQTRRTN